MVEDDLQLQKILQIKDRASTLKAIIQYTGIPKDPSVYSVKYIILKIHYLYRVFLNFMKLYYNFM